MKIQTLVVEARKPAGSRAAARLRRDGKLPAILYGHNQDPVALAMSCHDLQQLLHHDAHIVNLKLNGEEQACLIKEVQYDYLGDTPVHVDLARVNLSERVNVRVQLDLRGTPAGVQEGGVLQRVLKEIEVSCMVSKIPDMIRVDVSPMELDAVLHVKDLELEEGMEAVSEPEAVVAMVRVPAVKRAELEQAAEGEGAGPAEPEVIGKGKEEGDSGESA